VPAQYRRREQTVWRRAHGTVLVLPVPERDVLALNGPAAQLWQLLAEPLTVDQAADRLAEVYEVAADVAAHDIAPVFEELVARGVLHQVESA
jgi:hypothetical protein